MNSKQTVTMTEDQWVEEFKPEDIEVSTARNYKDSETKKLLHEASSERRLWTMVEDDEGNYCLTQGLHCVNFLFYIICNVPYDEDVEYVVEMDNDFGD